MEAVGRTSKLMGSKSHEIGKQRGRRKYSKHTTAATKGNDGQHETKAEQGPALPPIHKLKGKTTKLEGQGGHQDWGPCSRVINPYLYEPRVGLGSSCERKIPCLTGEYK